MPKVFISYSHKDQDFVEEFYNKLSRDGVTCFFDKESIQWGSNWVEALEKGIDESDIILLVLTPDYCKSEWSKLERTSVMADDPAGLKKRIKPLLLKDCGDDLPRFLKPVQHLDISSKEKFEKEYEKICLELGGSPVPEVQDVDRTKLPPICKPPDRHRMPHRSLGNGFAGRVADLWEIDDILRRQATAVIEGVGVVAGTGGLGKTQLAIEYAHRFGCHYPGGLFWIDAEKGISSMIASLIEGAELDIDTKLPEEKQLELLWVHLDRFKPVLIILDNFPEEEALQCWLPPGGNLRVLVTTRRRDLSYGRINLGFMTPDEGLELLNKGGRQIGEEGKKIVELLGGLPLALELARNFLNLRPELAVENLVEEIEKKGEMAALDIFADKYANELPSGHEKAVSATFAMSFDLASPEAKKLLQFMSLLAPYPVPRRLLRKMLDLPEAGALDDPLGDAVSVAVTKLSLLELDEENDPVIHRLVSGYIRTTLEKEKGFTGTILNAVEDEMARVNDIYDTKAYTELEKIIPQADNIIRVDDLVKLEIVGLLLTNIAYYYKQKGLYRLCENYIRQVLLFAEKSYEPGHPNIATIQSNLATVLQSLGELEEAQNLLRFALESNEKNCKPGHPSIAIRQSNLAMVLQDLDELEEARDLMRKVLESDEKNFEPGHPTIAISQSNLAMVLRGLGEPEEAHDLLRKALDSNEKSFESGHSSIATNQSNMGVVLMDLGELEEARDLMRKALASEEKSFEPGHPTIAISRSNLAAVLKGLGEFEEAVALARQAYEALLERLGPENPDTVWAKENLDGILAAMEKGGGR